MHFLSANTDSVRAFLSFQLAEVGGSGQQNVSVPVFVNDVVFTNIVDATKEISQVYPNPAHGNLYVNSLVTNSVFQLIGLDGKIVEVKNSESIGTIEFDLSNVAAGTYILKHSTRSNVQYSKIIVY